MEKICIIPARSGSTRIPNKNFKSFLGIPIFERVLNILKEKNLFDRIILSTDSADYRKIALELGCEVPFLRDVSLSDNHTATHPVVLDAINRLNLTDSSLVSCVYPTSVFLKTDDLEESMHIVSSLNPHSYVLPICKFSYPIQRSLRCVDDLYVAREPEKMTSRSQDLEEHFHDCGQFYTAKVTHWKNTFDILSGSGNRGIVVPSWRVQDIDTPDDWYEAEIKYKILQERGVY